jgi:hypothetical protein
MLRRCNPGDEDAKRRAMLIHEPIEGVPSSNCGSPLLLEDLP